MSPLVLHLSQLARNAHHCASQAVTRGKLAVTLLSTKSHCWQETLSNAHSFWNKSRYHRCYHQDSVPHLLSQEYRKLPLGSVFEFEWYRHRLSSYI